MQLSELVNKSEPSQVEQVVQSELARLESLEQRAPLELSQPEALALASRHSVSRALLLLSLVRSQSVTG